MTLDSRTGAASQLALLGGTPVRSHETRQYPVFSDEAKRHVAQLLDDGVMLGLSKLNPEIGAIEQALAEYHGVPHALGTSNGQGALQAALIGLELTGGDEVITSPNSWGVSVSCILHNNCIPTFADVVEGTGLLDPVAVEAAITERTQAILVPHIFGNPADMTALCAIASKHGLKVVEDGSQAHGARHRGQVVGSFGDAAGFSANGVKPIASTEAGFMLAKDEDTYWKAVVSTQHAGMGELPGRADEAGFPDDLRVAIDAFIYSYRLTPLNATLMLDRLQHIDAENEVRRRHLTLLTERLGDVESVSFPQVHPDDLSAVHQVIVHFDAEHAGISKQTYMAALAADGLAPHQYLPRPLNRNPRLSPEWSGPRVLWTDNLRRAHYDPTKLEFPNAERQVSDYFNLKWNYVDYDPGLIGRMADVFEKVEENLDALRAYERESGVSS